MEKRWRAEFGDQCLPHYRIIAPGRVNIIGEHIDHQNYSVLPCAIQKTVNAIVYKSDRGEPSLSVAHVNSTAFPSAHFPSPRDIKIEKHQWYNYIIAAYLGAVEYFGSAQQDANKVGTGIDPSEGLSEAEITLSGLNDLSPVKYEIKMLIFGDIPLAAGLSSSSALVVCGMLALDCVERRRAASVCASAERYVGTAGGGMDQAAICLSEEGVAQLIGFNPLTNVGVCMPKGVTLVIANTCREAPKARDMAKMYNKRVFELKTACYALIQQRDAQLAAHLTGPQLLAMGLREVCRDTMRMTEEQLANALPSLLVDRSLSKSEVDQILPNHLKDFLLKKRCGISVWEQNEDFCLFKRVKHVLSETIRVRRFVDICLQNRSCKETPMNALRELGALMTASQDSLRDDFECSCLELNELTKIALDAGALGSRLTGAGWGGCTVSLVPNDLVPQVLAQIRATYYQPYWDGRKVARPPLEHLPTEENINDALFATTPGQAARKEIENIFAT